MKIAFDVDVLAKQMDINRMVHQVADTLSSPHTRGSIPFTNTRYSRKNASRNTDRH